VVGYCYPRIAIDDHSRLARADNELLISQNAFSVPARRALVLHLRRIGSSDMTATYLESFDRIWTDTMPFA